MDYDSFFFPFFSPLPDKENLTYQQQQQNISPASEIIKIFIFPI